MKKPKPAETTAGKVDAEKDAAAILEEREHLRELFTPAYSPQIGVFADGKVEVMLKLTYAQAEQLARLLAERKLG